MAGAAIDKVRVIVVGDSGVGKTSLVHLISHGSALRSASWTVGCSVDVLLHTYREGTPQQRPCWVELWDVGGSGQHRNARPVFYAPAHAVLLVHDLSNRKSQRNLRLWLQEVLASKEDRGSMLASPSKYSSMSFDEFDAENSAGSPQGCSDVRRINQNGLLFNLSLIKIPILVIGTKLDIAEEKWGSSWASGTDNSLAQEVGAEELVLDCLQPRHLAPGSSNAVKLSRFFDKVIERRFYARDASPFNQDRRRYNTSGFGNSSYASPTSPLVTSPVRFFRD